jgi:hypothetical protein
MSSIQVQSNASGAGTVILSSPNTTGTYTLGLPTANTTLVGLSTTDTLTNKTIGAGTTTVPPLFLTSGTNLTSATAGAVEYDGKVVYATPIGTQRGIVPTQQYYRLNADLAGANSTAAQSLFGVGVTLSASTVYEFEIMFALIKSAGTTSHTMGLGFGGTATLNNIQWQFSGIYSTITNNIGSAAAITAVYGSTASNTTVTNGTTAASVILWGLTKGVVSVNAGGTFTPQYTLSAAPGGAYSTPVNSFIRIAPVGASGVNTNVGTWA